MTKYLVCPIAPGDSLTNQKAQESGEFQDQRHSYKACLTGIELITNAPSHCSKCYFRQGRDMDHAFLMVTLPFRSQPPARKGLAYSKKDLVDLGPFKVSPIGLGRKPAATSIKHFQPLFLYRAFTMISCKLTMLLTHALSTSGTWAWGNQFLW